MGLFRDLGRRYKSKHTPYILTQEPQVPSFSTSSYYFSIATSLLSKTEGDMRSSALLSGIKTDTQVSLTASAYLNSEALMVTFDL